MLLVQTELVSVFRGTTTAKAFRNRFFVCVGACTLCLYVCLSMYVLVCFSTMWMSGACKAKDDVWSFGAGVKDDCEPLGRCWELSLGPLIEQVFLNTEQFLQPQDPLPLKEKSSFLSMAAQSCHREEMYKGRE